MGLVDWFPLPVLGPIKGLAWLAEKVVDEAERELFDEDRIRGELLQLQLNYDLGEVAEADYDEQEAALLSRLNAAQEAKGR